MELGARLGCHQMPDRSFFFFDYQFPVCARCTGVLIGQITAVILALFRKLISPFSAFVCLMIMGADWFVQYIGVLKSNNTRRLISGFLGGLGLTFLYIHGAVKVFCLVKRLFK